MLIIFKSITIDKHYNDYQVKMIIAIIEIHFKKLQLFISRFKYKNDKVFNQFYRFYFFSCVLIFVTHRSSIYNSRWFLKF